MVELKMLSSFTVDRQELSHLNIFSLHAEWE